MWKYHSPFRASLRTEMGVYLTIARAPLDVAVDAIGGRMKQWELRRYVDEHLMTTGTVGDVGEGVPNGPFRVARLWKSHGPLFDILTGKAHDIDARGFEWERESADVDAWIVYGARKVAWEPEDYPLRYSLPSDVEAISASLHALTEAEVERRAHEVLRNEPGYERSRGPWLQTQVMRVLPYLKAFYDEARASKEIVLYLKG